MLSTVTPVRRGGLTMGSYSVFKDRLLAGAGFGPATSWLWATRATSALPRKTAPGVHGRVLIRQSPHGLLLSNTSAFIGASFRYQRSAGLSRLSRLAWLTAMRTPYDSDHAHVFR